MFPNQNAYDGIITAAASAYGLPFDLVKGIIAQESNFVARAYRAEPQINDASYGLMQLLLATARALGYQGTADGLYDPSTNINLGARFLSSLVQDAQANGWTIDSAISAYNAGQSADRAGDGKRDTSRVDGQAEDGSGLADFINQDYVDAVNNYRAQFTGGPARTSSAPAPTPTGSAGGGVAPVVIVGAVVLGLLAFLSHKR